MSVNACIDLYCYDKNESMLYYFLANGNVRIYKWLIVLYMCVCASLEIGSSVYRELCCVFPMNFTGYLR
jgi:hypothetical protein